MAVCGAKRRAIADEMEWLERDYAVQQTIQGVTEDQVAELIGNLAEEIETTERPLLKSVVRTLVERVTLNPETLECRVHYCIAVADRLCMASPRLRAEWPVLRRIEEVLVVSKR